jgi:hypothetical protein
VPIGGAELIVIEGVNINARATSDASGHYIFESMERGRFTINVGAPGFVGVNPIVDLYSDIEVNFALKPR